MKPYYIIADEKRMEEDRVKMKRVEPMHNIDPLTGEPWEFPFYFEEITKEEYIKRFL